jgi:hypothetical protein
VPQSVQSFVPQSVPQSVQSFVPQSVPQSVQSFVPQSVLKKEGFSNLFNFDGLIFYVFIFVLFLIYVELRISNIMNRNRTT